MERRSLDSTEFRRAKRCKTRAEYRTSKKETAVRVYTINDESRFLLVQNVSIFGDIEELAKRFAVFGPISKYKLNFFLTVLTVPRYCIFDEFERDDEYTNVLCFEYQNIADARDAKRKLNDYNFMSQLIHVTYAPQLESSDDTKTKLLGRRQRVLQRITRISVPTFSDVLVSVVCLLQGRRESTSLSIFNINHPLHGQHHGLPPLLNVPHFFSSSLLPLFACCYYFLLCLATEIKALTELEIERGTATQRPSSKNPNTTTNLPRWCTLTSAQGSRKK